MLEVCEHPEDAEDSPLHVAVAVLTTENDNVPLSIMVNTRMGLRVSAKGCTGAVVHVTGTKFTPPEESIFADSSFTLPEYLSMNEVVFGDDDEDEDYIACEEPDESDSSGDEMGLDDSEPKASKNLAIESKVAVESRSNSSDEKATGLAGKSVTEAPASGRTSVENPSTAKKKKGFPVIKHPSGLLYQDMIVGSGRVVQRGRNVALQYVLRLENGKVVDRADRKRPFKFRLGIGECIKGFDVGVIGMREGGERHLIVPPELGYGDQSMAGIPPGSTLYFDVTIVKAF